MVYTPALLNKLRLELLSILSVVKSPAIIFNDTDESIQVHKVTMAIVDLSIDLQWCWSQKKLKSLLASQGQELGAPSKRREYLPGEQIPWKSVVPHSAILQPFRFSRSLQCVDYLPLTLYSSWSVPQNMTFPYSLDVDQQIRETWHPSSKMVKSHGGC